MADPALRTAHAPAILSVGRALPGHYVDQETLTAALRAHWARQHYNADRLDELHRAVKVRGRHLALPLAEYPLLDTFKKSNDAWIRVAEELGADAITRALDLAGLRPAVNPQDGLAASAQRGEQVPLAASHLERAARPVRRRGPLQLR